MYASHLPHATPLTWPLDASRQRDDTAGVRHLAIAACVLLTACGADEGIRGGEPVPFRPSSATVPNFGEVPWPSDLYRSESGQMAFIPGLQRVLENGDVLQPALMDLDGFARSAGALFFVDGAIDDASLPSTWEQANDPDASVLLVDVDRDSPERGRSYPAYGKFLPSLGCISVIPAPGVVLPRGVRHAAVLTDRVRTTGGARLVPSAALAATWQRPPGQRDATERLYGDAADALVASGAVAGHQVIASMAVFTTSRRVEELPALRERLRALPEPELLLAHDAAAPYSVAVFGTASAPSLTDWLGTPEKDETGREWPGGDNPGGIAHDAIAVIASGAFVAPSFLNAKTRHFERDVAGDAVLSDPTAKIPVTLVLPKSPMPATGYPVVIHGHGLSNNRGSMLSHANEIARAGFAMIGIDDVLHGARQGVADEANNYKGTYQGPDGIPDSMTLPVAFFGGFSDFVATRDNFRQTILDQCSLVRLIQSSKLDLGPLETHGAAPGAKLDGTRIFWSGGSLGGIVGSMTAAVEPEIRAFALHVPGASFVQLITTQSAKVAPLVTTLASGAFGVVGDEPLDEFQPLANLLATVTEAGDPIGYAPHVLRDRLDGRQAPDVMITYAAHDEVLPNLATIALIRALGVERSGAHFVDMPGVGDVAAPVHENLGGRTAVAVEYGPANHGLGYQRFDIREFQPGVPLAGEERFPTLNHPFTFEMPIREHADQLVQFLSSAAQGQAQVVVTAPARDDFDGDGVDDAVELAKGTDPTDPKSH